MAVLTKMTHPEGSGDGGGSNSPLPIGIIAGASAGCCVLTVLAALFLRRRSQKGFSQDGRNEEPCPWMGSIHR